MVEGGVLTIYQNCLHQLSLYSKDKNIKIIALVADKSKFETSDIEYIEFPKSKKSWWFRLYYEYYYFREISLKLKPDVWFSLHDVSPNVVCKKRFVYCHNPNPFYKASLLDWYLEYKVGLFHYVYKFIYQINIKKNDAVFVQQNWMKTAFKNLYSINNVVVTPPEYIGENYVEEVKLDSSKIHFFYPSIARCFKNMEYIAEAILLLPKEIQDKIEVHLTIAKNENRYANYVIDKYNLKQLNFTGKLSRSSVFGYYKSSDCLLFPSKIETWGLPITEAKSFGLPMFVANLPYAKETVGDYEKVSFFDINNPKQLSELMTNFVNNSIKYEGNKYPFDRKNQMNNWFELFDFIFKN
jgi:glycosyltransferase involved in cell wall biosynthesis